jgi:hypothetical protein
MTLIKTVKVLTPRRLLKQPDLPLGFDHAQIASGQIVVKLHDKINREQKMIVPVFFQSI